MHFAKVNANAWNERTILRIVDNDTDGGIRALNEKKNPSDVHR